MYRIKSVQTGVLYTVTVCDEGQDFPSDEKYVVAKEFFSSLGIEEGALIDCDGLTALAGAAGLTDAVRRALDALSYSSMSRRALVDKLRFKYKIEKTLAEEAADYAVSRRYIDEESQAKKIAKSDAVSKLWGRRRIAADLVAKGYPSDVARDAADSVPDEVYEDALSRLVGKRIGQIRDASDVLRLTSALSRLGHSPSDSKRAIAKKLEEQNEE